MKRWLVVLVMTLVMLRVHAWAGQQLASKEVILSFVGDVTLGQDRLVGNYSRSFNATYQREGKDYFFSKVKNIFASADLVIANLEGVLLSTPTLIAPKSGSGRKFYLSGKHEYAQILKAGGIGLVNLANNHTNDYGASGLAQTKAALMDAGIDYFGRERVVVKNLAGIKVGFYGLTLGMASRQAQAAAIKKLQAAGAELIIANFHGGPERVYQPSKAQLHAANTALSLGAQVVIGHHAHVIQGVNIQPQHIIAYGLGNFCFGGNRNPQDKDSMIFQVKLKRAKTGKIALSAQALPASISSITAHNDYRPCMLVGEQAVRWQKKLQRLSAAWQ